MATLLTLEALEADKSYVEYQLAQPDNDPWGTVRLMWQSRLTEINRQIEELGAQSSNYASVALVFNGNPVVGSSDIRVDFTTDALTSFQKLDTRIYPGDLAPRLVVGWRQPPSDGLAPA